METKPIYTPVLKDTGVRIEIRKPEFSDGFSFIRARGYKGIVRDPETGNRYRITGKACSSPRCMCDAWAELITVGTGPVEDTGGHGESGSYPASE